MIILGKVRPLSGRLLGPHPQVLIIAPWLYRDATHLSIDGALLLTDHLRLFTDEGVEVVGASLPG